MKNIISIIALVLLIVGCKDKTKEVNAENAELRAELDELQAENAALAAGELDLELTIADYQATLLEIDANLANIDEKHNNIKTQLQSEVPGETIESDIKMHLEHIHGTMTNTKHKVAHMQKTIKDLHKQEAIDDEVILALEADLDQATLDIIEQDEVIGALNVIVLEEGIEIIELNQAYTEQAAFSTVLYSALNTAYVVIGTKKELKEFGIIDTEGGFLGLGKVKSLAADADDSLFVPISISDTQAITLECKKAKVLTNHPETSYALAGDKVVESLTILDPIAFWDKSDFLIIEIVKE